MTKEQRCNFFGTNLPRPRPDAPGSFEKMAREATARGQKQIEETRAALKNDPASSLNRGIAALFAKVANGKAIESMKNGGASGFNPLHPAVKKS